MAALDFLSDTCVAGQTILRLVSRGNAIVAELLRLSAHVPPVFRLPTDGSKAAQADKTPNKYARILSDFQYLKNSDAFEEAIDSSSSLTDLDAEFRELNSEILRRFYFLFESIYSYAKDLVRYLEELEEGVFIQLTFDMVLLNSDGKQLLTEAIYLYGVMLKLLDWKIEGVVRERMLISFLRYKGQTETPLLDEVCRLCRNTGYIHQVRKPPSYPEEYFARVQIPKHIINMIIGRLRSDDVYNQVTAYPQPKHRSVALATQGSMLYIILFFSPETLMEEQAAMREIVDKHFADNWVISFYLGFTVDLVVEWNKYAAAMKGLSNTINPQNITLFKKRHMAAMAKLSKDLDNFLTEGELNRDYVLENTQKLMAANREFNVTLRWLLLHTNDVQVKKIRDLVLQDYEPPKLLEFMLKVAQFEFILKKIFTELLETKEARWDECKKEAADRMKELGQYFSGEMALTRVKKNSSLMKWFTEIGDKVNQLDFNEATSAGRKIQQLMQALEEVEQFHQVETNLQVKQFLLDTRQYLNSMIRIANVRDEFLAMLSLVADFAYGWQHVHAFIPLMQEAIKRNPKSVIMLRSTFLKLGSIMDWPLLRINQAKSPDLFSVSEFFSKELVTFVRTVLSIVPQSMFIILNEIIDLQTNKIREVPTRLEKEDVKDYAQLQERYLLSRSTHAISVFTEGILAMETTLVGVVEVDPKQLLEDGIRKELVQKIANAMDKILVFKSGKKEPSFQARLKTLKATLSGLRRSFMYIQDYVNLYGLKIWQEELSRIVHFYVEQECNSFLKKKVLEWQSKFQSQAVPIPLFPPVDSNVTFIGRLAEQLVARTDFNTTTFLDQMNAWYRNGIESMGLRTFTLLLDAVGVFGVTGLDKLFSFKIVKEMQDFTSDAREELKTLKEYLDKVAEELEPISQVPQNTATLYSTAISKSGKLFNKFLEQISRIGQLILLRRQILNLLNFSAKIDAKVLYHSLDTFNKSLMNDIEAHYMRPDEKPYPDEDENPLLVELTEYLETFGMTDPILKIYITTQPLDRFPLLMFLFVLSQLPKFQYNRKIASLMPMKGSRLTGSSGPDVTAFICGFISLLKQFHSNHTHKFLGYVGQFIRIRSAPVKANQKATDIPSDSIIMLHILETFCKYSTTIDRKVLERYMPPYIFDQFTH